MAKSKLFDEKMNARIRFLVAAGTFAFAVVGCNHTSDDSAGAGGGGGVNTNVHGIYLGGHCTKDTDCPTSLDSHCLTAPVCNTTLHTCWQMLAAPIGAQCFAGETAPCGAPGAGLKTSCNSVTCDWPTTCP